MPPKKVLSLLEGFHSRDVHFSDGQIFGSMCTIPHPTAVKAHCLFLESNLGNRGLYPGTAEMENEVILEVGELLGLSGPKGQILSGGTEANILALWAARETTGKDRVLMARNAHFSFKKACQMLGLETVEIDLDENYVMDVQDLSAKIDHRTAAVIAVAGITETGLCDPIEKIGKALEGRNIPLHVDAAFGGFVLPFLDKPPIFDFTVPQLTSMTVDPHKMGMGTIPGGMLLYRDDSYLEGIRSHAPYLTEHTHYSITGTKGSAGVASAYAAIRSLGKDGYKKNVQKCMENVDRLIAGAKLLGMDPAVEPLTNVVVLDVGKDPGPKAIHTALKKEGYWTSLCREPPGLRLVIMPHIEPDHIDGLLQALAKVIQ